MKNAPNTEYTKGEKAYSFTNNSTVREDPSLPKFDVLEDYYLQEYEKRAVITFSPINVEEIEKSKLSEM